MSNDLNLCQFIGRLGKDPETRYLPDSTAVTSFSIACGWKGKNSEGTEWVNITAFGKLGEICGEYLVKGSQVYVSGRFKTEKWQDKNGQDRYSTKIIADKLQMLGRPQNAQQPRQQPAQQAPAQSQDNFSDFEDDQIPF